MGGGDLNRKLEEMDKKERRRMKELLKERLGEKSREETGVIQKGREGVDWMYKGPESHTNPDDYLLGKEVDQSILEAQHGKPSTGTQGGIESAGAVISHSASTAIDAKDMARKMREDPLFAIKKRELNNRKELVSNPIKMKQLQLMLQSQVGKDKKKSKKSKKYKEKNKKHKKSHAASSDSSSEEDGSPSPSKKRRLDHHTLPAKRHRVHDQHGHRRGESGQAEKRTMQSLDPAKMKKLLEREMLKKHHRHEDSSETSSSDSDSDERHATKQQRQSKSRHQSRGQYKEEDGKQKHRSHEKERDSQKRQDRSGSPEVVKRKHDPRSEKNPGKYGLEREARRKRSQSQSPERIPREQSKHHHSESKDRYTGKHGDRSPHRDSDKSRDKYTEKSQSRRKDNRSPSPPAKRDKPSDRYSDSRGEKHRRGRSHSRSPVRDRGEVRDRSRRSRSRSPQRQNGSQRNVASKRKLTAEEMERKRAEMMDNAKWRDDQRKERVKVYEKEEQTELEMEKKKAKNAEFVQPLKLPDNSSVEDRIHRNIYSIQRTKAALDKNFAKR